MPLPRSAASTRPAQPRPSSSPVPRVKLSPRKQTRRSVIEVSKLSDHPGDPKGGVSSQCQDPDHMNDHYKFPTCSQGSHSTKGQPLELRLIIEAHIQDGTKAFQRRFGSMDEWRDLRPRLGRINTMKKMLSSMLGVSSVLAIVIGGATVPAATANAAEDSYVACNQSGDCWRVHHRYAYGDAAPITYYNADWYDSHRGDPNIHWRDDPRDDRGYYDRGGEWHADPAARAVKVGATGAGLGAAIGC